MQNNLNETIKNPEELTKKAIDKIMEDYRKAKQVFNNACLELKNSIKEEDKKVSIQATKLNDQLKEIEAKSEELTSCLPGAAAAEGTEYEEIEEDLDKLNIEKTRLKNRLEQVSKIKSTGDDELYSKVLKAYSNLGEIEQKASKEIQEIIAAAEKWIEKYTEIKNEAVKNSNWIGATFSGTKMEDKTLLDIIEQRSGDIDVKGHHCGSDKDAKIRFIKGLKSNTFRGLENTPAYKELQNRRSE